MTISFRAESTNNYPGYSYQKDVKGGGFAAMCAGSGVALAANIPSELFLPNLMQKMHTYSDAEIQSIRGAAAKILDKQGLAKKGVIIKYLPELNGKPEISELLNPVKMAEHGLNAFFTPKDIKGYNFLTGEQVVIEKANTVIMPEKKLQGSVFHELGHADNLNNGKFLKLMQKIRPVSLFLPGIILLYGAFSKQSRPKDGQTELTNGQKTNNFIRDNAGKLAFASMLPILIEEGMATVKGHKWAKELLTPEVAKKALKGNLVGFASYISLAIASGLGAYAAVKIKDKKIAKKEAEIQRRQAALNALA